MKRYNILRLAVMAMLIAVGVVISPILRIEGMCPMAHLINITAAVLLGPLDAFLVALFIGIIRMCAMGIPPLALTGAVFGALLSGILYKVSKGKIWAAVLGEIIGTGIIGAIEHMGALKKMQNKIAEGGALWKKKHAKTTA